MLAATWTFGTVLWSTLVLFFWFTFVWMFIGVFADILRRHDLSGWGKAGWIVLIVVLPFLGILFYFIARPSGTAWGTQMVSGNGSGAQGEIGSSAAASEIAKAAELRDRGDINDAEFEQIKRRVLAA
jgi:Phospholipase_D-nuclease N-terminal/Short C-terminal domain